MVPMGVAAAAAVLESHRISVMVDVAVTES
jgi:hypothetical protein